MEPDEDRLDRIFMALSDRTRRAVLRRLRDGPLTAGDLAAGVSLSQPTVSKHLKVLEAAGLISRHRDGTRLYGVLAIDSLVRAAVYVSQFEEQVDARLDRLAAIVERPREELHEEPGEAP
ncbi:metalloregulator ArsR/SmtB family transcription factor [Amycolatopsis sp. PS_44_ISF1]|uniref:ArsR/SmtB family transcription factor n=1 Tax=Amycolatopsis sp. PS_44_ISF1 TaxID=2974917 RepID=UPI0028DFE128|nr:metalloregulator ArsR/SmtB family transcription factor [Amycolatopsis sp. PS_44_ISF1]MDT8915030.1 metalloregulator ArsR/SmtB family transcription factor [Amycolatopsis sp. PS_44_ISF1]